MNNELNINSNTPEEPNKLNLDQIRQTEAYKFLQTAYSAGINIIIEGATGSGKTTLLKNLINSTEDNESTILLTTFFEMETPKATQIKGDDPLWLIHQARRMTPFRIILDDLYVTEEEMESIVSGALTGTQFVSTGYTHSLRPKTDSLSSRYIQHPYELRVHVAVKRNSDENKRELKILSISQVIHQKVSKVAKDNRKYFYDSTSNHLLFEGDKKIADPTRTMRRKIEFAQGLNKSKREENSRPENDHTLTETSVNNFVSISPEEKAKLMEHRAILHEHFQSQSENLQESFKEIEKLIARL